MIKPKIMTGTCEYLPETQRYFNKLLSIIRQTYEDYGFEEIITPSFEHKEILLSKEGGETEKQVYFIQSTGGLEQNKLPDAALRFDLTIPLARYVAQHERELAFPFRRYQIQPVWRGERAQKGRFREFYQCDIDVVGKDKLSIEYDAEMPAIIYDIFSKIGLKNFEIQINHRKLLRGIFTHFKIAAQYHETILRQIDKLDKIGKEKTIDGLKQINPTLPADALMTLLTYQNTPEKTLKFLSDQQINNEDFNIGFEALTTVLNLLEQMNMPKTAIKLNLLIARGLDYYTGAVFETVLKDAPKLGSICSGGRYDNLASKFTKSTLPGVGISIGLTRLFAHLIDNNFFENFETEEKFLLIKENDAELPELFQIAQKLRAKNKITEIYFEPVKLKKQLKYANDKQFSYVVFKDRSHNHFVIKDMKTSQQVHLSNFLEKL